MITTSLVFRRNTVKASSFHESSKKFPLFNCSLLKNLQQKAAKTTLINQVNEQTVTRTDLGDILLQKNRVVDSHFL